MNDKKKACMLTLEPSESIVFEGPFNRSQCKSLIIGNPSKTLSVAFKLKTNLVRRFFVHPNIGTIGPDAKVTVEIHLQPISHDADQKQIKFLVQAALFSGSDINVLEFWKEKKSADIWESKIMCALVQRKPSEERPREAGGATSPKIECAVVQSKPSEEGPREVGGDTSAKIECALVQRKPSEERPREAGGDTSAKIECALVQRKPSEEGPRETGGATTTLDPKSDGVIGYDAQEVSDPIAQLLKQVSVLEDERIVLREELSILQEQSVVHYSKPMDMEFFIVASCVLTIVAALVGAYCGKLYL